MSEEAPGATNGSVQQSQSDEMPHLNLFVRASLIDNETQGACPMSQQGFMLCYLLAQEKNIDFKVWTVNQVMPPQDFKDKNTNKIYPFIEGIGGKDVNGRSIEGVMPDSTDKTEDFLDSVNFDCPLLKRPKILKDHILGKIDGIFTAFNALVKTGRTEPVTKILQKVDSHLAANGATFLEGESLSYTDCFLLPRLHHIIIAGKYFSDYEIPPYMKHVWRYLRDAYETPAFSETLATDEDICKFHWEKFNYDLRARLNRERGVKGRFGVMNPEKKTKSIPHEIAITLDENTTNGDEEGANCGDEEEQFVQQTELEQETEDVQKAFEQQTLEQDGE